MCGRFSLTIEAIESLAARFHAEVPSLDIHARYNIAPAQSVLTVTQKKGSRQITPMKWGLVPHWGKSKKATYQLVNVRSESLLDKPYFRRYAEKQRCLIPADGFFEWRTEGDKKIPYRAIVKDESIFAFAGLWDLAIQADGTQVLCVTILTTDANALLASIHDRMPVILQPDAEEKWLNPSIHLIDDLYPLLRPYPAKKMELYAVSPHVNSWKHDDPSCITSVDL